MRALFLLLVAVAFSYSSQAQKPVTMRNLWARPQVHVIFGDYTLSFTIKDIDKALHFLAESGYTGFGTSCGLDTAGDYAIQLTNDTHLEYRNPLQPMIQNGVGCFLIMSGHALILNKKHRQVTTILVDEQPLLEGGNKTSIQMYNAKNNDRVFTGEMRSCLHGRDIGID